MKDIFFAALIKSSDIGFDGPKDDKTIMTNILNPVYFWAGVIAVIVIVAAGFYYTTSNGNSAQVARAKNAILGAVVGLIVILAAFAITSFITGAF